jgi:NTP pyrophosphatase (non-canonical NTP hydrolase)
VTDYRILNEEICSWQHRNFGVGSALVAVAGLGEEVGEVMRCAVKDHQGIRGTHEEWMTELGKELGDAYIKLVDVARYYGIDLDEAITNRWDVIRRRDWLADPLGHGIS